MTEHIHTHSHTHTHTHTLFFWISFPFRSTQSAEWSFLSYIVGSHYLFYTQCHPDSSVGKEFTCNSGDPSSIPGSGKSTGKGIGYPLQYSWASLVAQMAKNPPAMRDLGSIPGLGRSPGGGNGSPLQYSCLENPMDRGAWLTTLHGAKKSWT